MGPQPTCQPLNLSPIYSQSPFDSLSGSGGLAPSPQGAPSSSLKRTREEYTQPEPSFSYPSSEFDFIQASHSDVPFFVNAPMNRIDRLEHIGQWENDSSWAHLLNHPQQQSNAPNPLLPPSAPQHELIQKGILTEDALHSYWWRFHEACAYRVGWSEDGHTLALALRESKLLVAAVCSVGARSLQAHADAANCLNEAKMHARDLVFYSDLRGSPSDYLDIKGLLILSVYWSLPHLMSQSASSHTLRRDVFFFEDRLLIELKTKH